MRKSLFILLLPFLFFGCRKTNQAALDQQTIQNYISANHLTAIAEPNGLYYVPLVMGTGPYPTINSTVTVNYTGTLANGTVFDQESNISFALSSVIAGWQEGIPLMQKGGQGILLIPSALGYGASSAGSVPPNSVLIFNVQLISFQ